MDAEKKYKTGQEPIQTEGIRTTNSPQIVVNYIASAPSKLIHR